MDKKIILENANKCKIHLEKHPRSFSDCYYDYNDIKEVKKIFNEILGEDLIKRVNFLPK